VFAEGELRNVLRAIQVVVDEGLAKPIVIGRKSVVENRIRELDLRIRIGQQIELCDPEDDPRYPDYWRLYHKLFARAGITPEEAKTVVRTNTTVIGALMVRRGEADAMICGASGNYLRHLPHVTDIIGVRPGVKKPSALTALILNKGTYFISDTHVSAEPTVDELVEQTLLAVEEVRRFGLTPKVALLSYSNFGSRPASSPARMREALARLQYIAPDLEVEGEMHGDAAMSEDIRLRAFPESRLKGTANLLIMPSLNSANIAFNLLKSLGDGLSVGPMLLGMAQPAHIVTESVTVRGLVNITALAVVDAQTVAAKATP
jgi:malate dehydrogenase (oxaloacetate-decarboxylating)(NADP+)